MIIQTSAGAARVMHRLALAVEVPDTITDRLADMPVRVGREVAAAPGAAAPGAVTALGSAWPCRDLERSGTARFKLRRSPQLPPVITLRMDDRFRRYVPRRVSITLWPEADIEAIDNDPPTGPYIPVKSRLLRTWLSPGSGYLLPGGTTAIRGRVLRGAPGAALSPGNPVRWPRVTAIGPGNVPVGWAHGDERGEFLLPIASAGTLMPVDAQFAVDLDIFGLPAAQAPQPDLADRCADLVVETVPRSAAPPAPGDLDNDLLRGRAVPPGYVGGTAPRPHLTVNVGSVLSTGTDLPFPD